MIRAIILDFDGLILETEEPEYISWQEMFESFGCELDFNRWATIIGTAGDRFDPLDELEKQLGYPLERHSIIAKRMDRALEMVYKHSVRPGVGELLQDAKDLGLKIGLATSSECDWVNSHLSRLGLIDFFDCIIASDDVQHVKPDPELFLTVLSELNIRPEEAIVFEDSPNGVTAAKRAGLFCVAVPNSITKQLSLDHADIQLNSLADISLEEFLGCIESYRQNPPLASSSAPSKKSPAHNT